VSPSGKEEDERGTMPTAALKDLLKKWENGTQTKLISIGLEISTTKMLLITSGKSRRREKSNRHWACSLTPIEQFG
jgi:hypothetical protein